MHDFLLGRPARVSRKLMGACLVVILLTGLVRETEAAKRKRKADSERGPRADFAFIDATVLPMDTERLLEHQTVLIRDGRILDVLPADSPAARKAVRAAKQSVSAKGRFLMPGVSEMHGHYPHDPTSTRAKDVLFLYLANGVTLVRGMQGGPQHLEWRDSIERGELLGPRLLVCAPMMHGKTVTSVADARARVRDAKDKGFDHLKVHEGLSPEVYDAIADASARWGIPFAGHVSNHVGLRHALKKGQQTIDHLDNYLEALVANRDSVAELGLFELGKLAGELDRKHVGGIVEATLDSGAGVVPTMALWEVLFGSKAGAAWVELRPELRYMSTQQVSNWVAGTDQRVAQFGQDPAATQSILSLRRDVLKALVDGGVPVLLGTDSPQIFSVPGFSIHHEMKLYVETGLSPWQVLEAGTNAVAKFYGETEDYGTVQPGRRADLVLLNSNPAADITNFADRAGVMVKGRWLDETAIQAELSRIASRVRPEG